MNPQKILLVRSDHLGDMLFCLPVTAYLKRCFPNCQIDFVAPVRFAPVLAAAPYINKVWRRDELDAVLAKNAYDVYIGFWENETLNNDVRIRRIPIRIGYRKHWWQRSQLTHPVVFEHQHTCHAPQVLQNAALLAPLGLFPQLSELVSISLPGIYQGSGTALHFGVVLDTAGTDRAYGIANVKLLLPLILKRWPQSKVLLLGAPSAGNDAEQLIAELSAFDKNIENHVGNTIAEMLELYKTLSLLVVGNTGPSHLAAAIGLPQVSLAITQSLSLTRWAPWALNATVLRRQPACTIICCPPSCADAPLRCQLELAPAQVVEAIATLLEQGAGFENMAEYLLDLMKRNFCVGSQQPQLVAQFKALGWQAFLIPKADSRTVLKFLRQHQILVWAEPVALFSGRRLLLRVIHSNYVGVMPMFYALKADLKLSDFLAALGKHYGFSQAQCAELSVAAL